jgi:hypothetical protein
MAKLFIDNEILPKAFRKLEPSLKLTWYYIWTHCDKSGVWEIDEDLFEFDNGFEFDLKAFKENFSSLIKISNEKILLIDFIKVNYGTLTANYNPHKPAFRDLHKNNLKLEPSLNQASFKLVDEDEDEDKEEDKEEKEKPKIQKKPKATIKIEEVVFPFETEKFKVQWQLWKAYKSKEYGFKYKSIQSEQASLIELSNLSNGIEETAILIMNQSMAKGWKGFFELKNNYQYQNEKPNSNTGFKTVSKDFARQIAEGLQSK